MEPRVRHLGVLLLCSRHRSKIPHPRLPRTSCWLANRSSYNALAKTSARGPLSRDRSGPSVSWRSRRTSASSRSPRRTRARSWHFSLHLVARLRPRRRVGRSSCALTWARPIGSDSTDLALLVRPSSRSLPIHFLGFASAQSTVPTWLLPPSKWNEVGAFFGRSSTGHVFVPETIRDNLDDYLIIQSNYWGVLTLLSKAGDLWLANSAGDVAAPTDVSNCGMDRSRAERGHPTQTCGLTSRCSGRAAVLGSGPAAHRHCSPLYLGLASGNRPPRVPCKTPETVRRVTAGACPEGDGEKHKRRWRDGGSKTPLRPSYRTSILPCPQTLGLVYSQSLSMAYPCGLRPDSRARIAK